MKYILAVFHGGPVKGTRSVVSCTRIIIPVLRDAVARFGDGRIPVFDQFQYIDTGKIDESGNHIFVLEGEGVELV